MKTEKVVVPFNGYLTVVLILASALLITYGGLTEAPVFLIIFIPLIIILAKGLTIVSPNSSQVLLLFGKYRGTVKSNGLF